MAKQSLQDKKDICIVRYDKEKECFFAYMPDGTKIPNQVNMRLTDNLDEPLVCSIDFICKYELWQEKDSQDNPQH